ncbi:unnamed protein product [marine sediment metagenome]|uniref:UDP-3-O-[3-hydroxymyristoyl] glucosamine N-acyltransferase non-repeat region domain-containing protein n=1 Tax=marine sediment metagenome TaxID=412755 RepID=X1M7P1_9ZZZZ
MSNHISDKAKLGKDITFAKNIIIEDYVTIGDNCQLGYNVVIRKETTIGDNVRIDDNTVIGKYPMRASLSIFKEDSNLPPTNIGNNCLIGANTVIYIGSSISNNVLIADLASIRENTTICEYTIVGRGVTIENYVKIGKRCKLESECYITAYSELEDYVFIAPGVVTSNDNFLGRTEEIAISEGTIFNRLSWLRMFKDDVQISS